MNSPGFAGPVVGLNTHLAFSGLSSSSSASSSFDFFAFFAGGFFDDFAGCFVPTFATADFFFSCDLESPSLSESLEATTFDFRFAAGLGFEVEAVGFTSSSESSMIMMSLAGIAN
jgi:hypothetical protein